MSENQVKDGQTDNCTLQTLKSRGTEGGVGEKAGSEEAAGSQLRSRRPPTPPHGKAVYPGLLSFQCWPRGLVY